MALNASHLEDAWRLRNAAATTLALAEEQVRRSIETAGIDDLAGLIELYSPAVSLGPEWTRTFEPLIERMWLWSDDATMASLHTRFKSKGMPWLAVANALSPEHGERVRAAVRQPAWARLPAFTTA
jgi:hypothetical protein